MLQIPTDDDSLACLERTTISSRTLPDVSYRIQHTLGTGGMAVAFFAVRAWPGGAAPVVLKVIRPSIMRAAGQTATLVVQKETMALGRLNERVPATPFVLRLVECDSLPVQQESHTFELPWLGLEYVHGGMEGTTLEERILYSIENAGFAFDPDRAAHAVECMAAGLDAVHEVGVIHRDITPRNVLCCGFGEDEIFKIADFGIARPVGAASTFGAVPVGTPGYAAPEQTMLDDKRMGPTSDVFSFAASVFRMLTGDHLFLAKTAVDCVVMVQDAKRRSITECRWLSPELRDRPATCAAIDAALARATSPDPARRPPTAALLAQELVPSLRQQSGRLRPKPRHLRSISRANAPTILGGWKWTVRHAPGDDRAIRSVSWDGDGRCLAATGEGLAFWNGTAWENAPVQELPIPHGIRFVRRVGAGLWLVGGDEGIVAYYSSAGVSNVMRSADTSVTFYDASGEIDDLAVLVGGRRNESPMLLGLAARRWLKPTPLPKASVVNALSRLEDERWLLVGRSTSETGFIAVYSPLRWEVDRVKASPVRAYLGCAAKADLKLGMVVGASGRAVRFTQDGAIESVVPAEPDLSAVALDIGGRAWATSAGTIWLQQPERTEWSRAWSDPSWAVPFISVYADVGFVIGVTADGGIVEGRSDEHQRPGGALVSAKNMGIS